MTRESVNTGYMGLQEMSEHMSYYATLTVEEKARMHPCRKAKCVMMSGDSPPPLQSSLPAAGFDVRDEARPGKISPTTPLSVKPLVTENDAEAIEEVGPIVKKTLPVPEPQPKIERNGIDLDANYQKKPVNQPDDDSCVINCIYFTQQCCECTIL